MMLSENSRLTNSEVIFEEFQNVMTIPQRYGWTDRQTDHLP